MAVFTLGDIPVTNMVERTGTITATSGVVISNLRAKQIGKVVEVRFLATKSGGFGTSEIDIGTLNGVDLPPQNIKSTCGIVTDVIIEDGSLTFSSGAYVLPAKSGYRLANAYAIGRPTSEGNSYAITAIQQRTDGTYRLQNVNTTLGVGLSVRRVWVSEIYSLGMSAYCLLNTSGHILVRADSSEDTVIDVGIVYTVDSGITEGTTEIIDDLVTDNPLAALSARQGKVLDEKIDDVKNTSGAGYCKMPDGTLICWGLSQIPANATNVIVNFPQTFLDASYGLSIMGVFANTRALTWAYAAQTGNSVTIYRGVTDVSYAQDFRWLAVGRWK